MFCWQCDLVTNLQLTVSQMKAHLSLLCLADSLCITTLSGPIETQHAPPN